MLQAPALVQLLSNFTGLYTDHKIIRQLRGERSCEAGRAIRKRRARGAPVTVAEGLWGLVNTAAAGVT